jgi:LmbE family N-acetylglucosaminyl deacetylase
MEPTAITVFALGCHPDDIEFMMGGTLLLLKAAGCRLHVMSLANGNCGSTRHTRWAIARIRRGEAQASAALLGAELHRSLANDLEVYYSDRLLRRLTAVMREIQPDVLLLPSPQDYMEDHMNTSRLGVSAAFCRGIGNFRSIPRRPPTFRSVVPYHAMPYGLRDSLRRRIWPDFYVDIGGVIEAKERLLACHQSQKRWLDESQGLDSYLATMREMSAEVGRMAGGLSFAEGWRRHSHLGFASPEADPLRELLAAQCRDERRGGDEVDSASGAGLE